MVSRNEHFFRFNCQEKPVINFSSGFVQKLTVGSRVWDEFIMTIGEKTGPVNLLK